MADEPVINVEFPLRNDYFSIPDETPVAGKKDPYGSDYFSLTASEDFGGLPIRSGPSIVPSKEDISKPLKPSNPPPRPIPPKSLSDASPDPVEAGQQYAGVTDWLKGLFSKTPDTKTVNYPSPGNTEFPTKADAAFAAKQDYSYGSSYEPFFKNELARFYGSNVDVLDSKGKKVKGRDPLFIKGAITEYRDLSRFMGALEDPAKTKLIDLQKSPEDKKLMDQVFARATLAANRDPLAQLGFDPKQVVVDMGQANIYGAYSPLRQGGNDLISVNTDAENTQWSTVVHESIHRGIDKLVTRNEEAAKIFKKLDEAMPHADEYITRYIMDTKMGQPERYKDKEGKTKIHKQTDDAIYWFEGSMHSKENKKDLDRFIKLAEEEIAKKRPGGPR